MGRRVRCENHSNMSEGSMSSYHQPEHTGGEWASYLRYSSEVCWLGILTSRFGDAVLIYNRWLPPSYPLLGRAVVRSLFRAVILIRFLLLLVL